MTYYGGPGYPISFAPVGPLVVNEDVAIIVPRPEDPTAWPHESGYGIFTGALPYPESTFAPHTAAAATGGTSGTARPYPPGIPDAR
jgi:hypothetical protein